MSLAGWVMSGSEMDFEWEMKVVNFLWRMKAVWGMEVEWVMEVSLVTEVEGVVGVEWDGNDLIHTEQEVQHHAFVLHV